MISEETVRELIAAAGSAREFAYVPYSLFTVGAALLGSNGVIYTGCNVENASYGLSICAERNAVFHAVASGCRSFEALAIVSDGRGYTSPCGACRQVLEEFEIPYVILTAPDSPPRIVALSELLPLPFDRTAL